MCVLCILFFFFGLDLALAAVSFRDKSQERKLAAVCKYTLPPMVVIVQTMLSDE